MVVVFQYKCLNIGTVGLPRGSSIILKDSDGFFVPCCAQLSSGQSYTVVETPGPSQATTRESISSAPIVIPSVESKSIVTSLSTPPSQSKRPPSMNGSSSAHEALLSDMQRSSENHIEVPSRVSNIIEPILDNRMTKFERLTTHLANERTFLAWVRTSVSVIGLAVTYSSLASHEDPALFWSGCR
jgi:hypothetical protein